MKQKLSDANFPHTADGRVYHLGVKRGEVANRILTVGEQIATSKFESKGNYI